MLNSTDDTAVGMTLFRGPIPYQVFQETELKILEKLQGLRGDALSSHLLVAEVEPVVTVGRSSVVVGEPAQVVRVRRGGGITYHGPGMLLVHWVEPVSQRLGVRTLTQRMLGASLRTVQALVTGAAGSLIWAVESETKRAGLWGSDQRKYVSVGFSISRRVLHGGVCIHVERRPESFAGVENPCGLRREEIGFLSDQFTLAQEGKFLNSWLGSVGEEQLLELLKL